MTRGEIQAVIFVAVSMLAGAVILLVKQYNSDFLPDLGPASAHGRLNAGIETASATADVDDSNARLPSTRADSGRSTIEAADSGRPATGPDSGHPADGNLLVPVNTAPASELQKLPGIGPKLAEAIIEYRTRSGPFERVEELLEVKGIGPAKLGRIRPLVKLK
ncbi:MAG: ComEA family DNA-binding protein [Gemmatimonadetes bacterium]|nr:ComEA family DNA-binding protein [Gemmatimonadota bacterium]MYD27007.1 ComEA family DNA-binding protein [Gemmatimonadota bacterium]MYI98870.1 ComEA family DNA-binding protein [Gemmatimonadota bacterium]